MAGDTVIASDALRRSIFSRIPDRNDAARIGAAISTDFRLYGGRPVHAAISAECRRLQIPVPLNIFAVRCIEIVLAPVLDRSAKYRRVSGAVHGQHLNRGRIRRKRRPQ